MLALLGIEVNDLRSVSVIADKEMAGDLFPRHICFWFVRRSVDQKDAVSSTPMARSPAAAMKSPPNSGAGITSIR